MGHENSALKSWLPRAGTIRRKLMLKKLKGNLERKGMSPQEVYQGLLQLATTPRVMVVKLQLSEVVEIVEEEKVSESEDNAMEGTRDNEDLERAPKATTPELLDDNVGNPSSFIVKIPRKAIMLNLNSYGSQGTKVAHQQQTQPSTEIRVADSSVSDDDDESSTRVSSGMERNREEEHSRFTGLRDLRGGLKKPKIVEDVTCVEGTILARASLINSATFRGRVNSSGRNKSTEDEKSKLTGRIDAREKPKYRSKMRARNKLRLRREFRRVFGNDPTHSELDEEDDIIERFIRKKRRKNWRNSSDSGVGLTDTNSDDVFIRPITAVHCRDSSSETRRESLDKRVPSTREEISVLETSEEKDPSDTLARSMPSLDLNPSNESLAEALPDSSTSSDENPAIQADSSMEETIKTTTGTLRILVSPVNAECPNAFPPVSFEIDVPCETQISTLTSTTEHLPPIQSPRTREEETTGTTGDQELKKLLGIDAFNDKCNITLRGNTISIKEKSELVISPQDTSREVEDARIESIIVDYSTSGISNGETGGGGVTITIAHNYSNQRMREISPDVEAIDNNSPEAVEPVPEEREKFGLEMALKEEEKTMDGRSQEAETVPDEDTSTSGTSKVPLCPPPRPPMLPKFRVLHHSELGSRWCPTPLASNESTQTDASQSVDTRPVVSPISTVQPHSRDSGISDRSPQPNSLDYLELLYPKETPLIPSTSNVASTTTTTTRSCNNFSTITLNYTRQSFQNKSPAVQPFSPNLAANSMLGTIFNHLLSLNWCIERNQFAYILYDPVPLQIEFRTKKPLLWQELQKFSAAIGSRDVGYIVGYIVNYYEQLMPPGQRVLNMEKVLNILDLHQLPLMPLPVQQQVGTYYAPTNPSQTSSFHPLPPPYPAVVPSHISGNNLPPLYASSSQRVLAADSTQQGASTDRSWQSSSLPRQTVTIFTAQQLETLRDQIATYNYYSKSLAQQLASSQYRALRRKRRARNEEAATLKNPTSNRENLPATVFVDPASAVVREPEYIVKSGESQSMNDQPPAINDASSTVRVADVLQELAVLSSRSSGNIDKPSEKDRAETRKSSVSRSTETMEAASLNSIVPTSNDYEKTEIRESDASRSVDDEVVVIESNDGKSAPTPSQVAVITLDDDSSEESTETLVRADDQPNFSILEVKSISKDDFNSMGDDEKATSSPLTVAQQSNEDECLHCGKPSLVACERCYVAFYCSSECHESHWTESHHLTCKPVPEEVRLESTDPSSANSPPQGRAL